MKKFLIVTTALVISAMFLSFLSKEKSEKMPISDKYKVIKVDGKILVINTQLSMKKGDVYLTGTNLDFKTPQSRAAIISKIKGRFVLSASKKGQAKILPAANNISSRSGALINVIDLQNHFEGRFLVIDSAALEIGKEAFPQNDGAFFYLAYYHNDEQIRKKLEHSGNKVILDRDEIFKIDGRAIDASEKEMTLFYRNGDKSTKINTFTPVFADSKELKEEVDIILEEYNGKEQAVKVKEITAYLNEFYGKPQKENLNEWLDENFQIAE